MNKTELILNSDGSLYHLALMPGEVSDAVITVGDPERVRKVSQHFDSIEVVREKREFVTHTGLFRGKRLSVISTGIGTDNVDIVINELHDLKKRSKSTNQPYRFIRLGTSGTVRPEVDVNTVLISEAALGFDGLLHFYDYQDGETEVQQFLNENPSLSKLPRPYTAKVSDLLFQQFKDMADLTGVTVTAPGFYAPQGRSVNSTIKVPDFVSILSKSQFDHKPVTNIEMETAGIYGLASLLGHHAISISAILANRITGEFSEDPEGMMEDMISKALDILVD